ncbi:hypothetical protein [Enteractinococcus helveticum]|uniref:Uncharacterized protein n=1 Tax=Enteractinococcus helveticum TaxID=1837282 RepID=A0A1B7M344_9MICC|nr:hypothetical protein [Enteractinococcus helveticum]OAV62959.1 hypothetical protein A6F49_03940 [Enteractinococcus helveticum]
MLWLLLLILGPLIFGLLVAFTWWLLRRRAGLLGRKHRAIALIVGLFLFLGITAERLIREPWLLPFDLYWTDLDLFLGIQFVTPLLLGIIGLAVLVIPLRSRSGGGVASLAPRTPASFSRRSWMVVPVMVLAVVLVLTIITGMASEPDPSTGRYTMYFVDVGAEYGMGTSIYGWFHSVPSLILLAMLAAGTVLNLSLIARPGFGADYDEDFRIRTIRTSNVLAVTTGALFVHLGAILDSIARTASIQMQFSVGGEAISSWTSFAALGPALQISAGIAVGVGVAYWLSIALSAVPVRQLTRSRILVS